MYVVYINLLYFLSIFLFTYNKNLLSQKNTQIICSELTALIKFSTKFQAFIHVGRTGILYNLSCSYL